jgi:hypothetical protein
MNVLDLDVVRVSPSEKGNEWTVGRYWGSKLFLSYSYTPEDAANQVLKAEYSLNPALDLRGPNGVPNRQLPRSHVPPARWKIQTPQKVKRRLA